MTIASATTILRSCPRTDPAGCSSTGSWIQERTPLHVHKAGHDLIGCPQLVLPLERSLHGQRACWRNETACQQQSHVVQKRPQPTCSGSRRPFSTTWIRPGWNAAISRRCQAEASNADHPGWSVRWSSRHLTLAPGRRPRFTGDTTVSGTIQAGELCAESRALATAFCSALRRPFAKITTLSESAGSHRRRPVTHASPIRNGRSGSAIGPRDTPPA
jgi:hypothetical protein